MIKLLKNADVYAPAHLGRKDVLVVGEKICRIADHIDGYDGLPDVEVYDLEGKILTPGYIDIHIHITGGGGESGPTTRCPESKLSDFFKNGVTTTLGLLGTDCITRSLENLVAKARALNEEGLTVYTITGSYGYPSATLTGSVERDIVMVPPMVGVKVAVSDHRSSNPGGEELIALGSAVRRAGLLSGAPGLVVMHMGDGKAALQPLFDALDNSDIPPKHFLPTHMDRNDVLIPQGIELIRRGGYIDFTCGTSDEEIVEYNEKLLRYLRADGVTADHVSLSSDSFGSQPKFDENGECIGLTYVTPKYLHPTILKLVESGIPLEEALKILTTTPATLLGKTGIKGCVKEGADADLMVLDKDLKMVSLFARGKTAVLNGELLMKGTFE